MSIEDPAVIKRILQHLDQRAAPATPALRPFGPALPPLALPGLSVGAKRVFLTPPYPSIHNLGTCRMSAKASEGVVNGQGQSHDISNYFVSDGSQYTSGAAVNPTLTIVTLAIRQADYIASQMTARAL